MPIPSKYAQLLKVDRRKQWKALKSKHAKVISKAKLNFDQKLGPGLDKYQTLVEKISQLAAKSELNSMQVDPVMMCSAELSKIASAYKTSVKALEDPARKELSDLLTAIENDAEGWKDLAVATMGTLSKGTTDAQKVAANTLAKALDEVRLKCLMYVQRGPRALAAYKAEKKALAINLASQLIEAAQTTGAAANQIANLSGQVVKGSNYELFKARAATTLPLITNTMQIVEEIKKHWDINLDADTMTMTGDVDANAIKSSHDQMKVYCDAAVGLIHKLP